MIAHNKGKQYINCPECKRKRYCKTYVLNYDWREWVCSKGHEWKTKIPYIAKIAAIELERILPKIKTLFDRDDAFYRELTRRR